MPLAVRSRSGIAWLRVDYGYGTETAYPKDAAYDMEAAGFYAQAAGLTTTDLVHVFKIVSDNRENPVSKVDPK